MRVALISLDFPPDSFEGIPRQRDSLAGALATLGVDVHVIALGKLTRSSQRCGFNLHVIAPPADTVFHPSAPGLNRRLTQSQLLFEAVASLEASTGRFNVIDGPLWSLQSYVTAHFAATPFVLWLQTTQAQLHQIHGRTPGPWESRELDLERLCLSKAPAWLADSQSIVSEIELAYGVNRPALTDVAHLGLSDLTLPERSDHRGVTSALVVGRLEKRKGTQLLFEALPSMLRAHPDLAVRFVGADNSQTDGWHAQHGLSYASFWARAHPELAARVQFTGAVDEDKLLQAYADADLVIAPSLYESFGLVYIEAMRAGVPVIALSAGAAQEVFPGHERDGAMLISRAEASDLIRAVGELVTDGDRRLQIGAAGRRNYEARFSAHRMARDTLAFYEKVIAAKTLAARPATPQPTYQVMEALDVGDAVSTITRLNAEVLQELGQPPRVIALYHHPSLDLEVDDPRVLLSAPDSHVIFHYWGYSHLAWQLKYHRGLKALYYHNITPWRFFDQDSPAYRSTQAGYKQLSLIANDFDFLMGDSVFNIQELSAFLRETKPALCVYPTIDADSLRNQPVDEPLLHALTTEKKVNFLMVGRIARNKRQDRVMQVFDCYWRTINRGAHLWLVGSDASDPGYRQELIELLSTLKSRAHIHFTGKIPDQAVTAHYRAASVFVCASEHEGFCMPLIEAMAHGVPVVAWSAAAVPETMGRSGILVKSWDEPRLAELIHLVLKDDALRQHILGQQTHNLQRFTRAATHQRLKLALGFMNGEINEDPSIFHLMPNSVGPDQIPSNHV